MTNWKKIEGEDGNSFIIVEIYGNMRKSAKCKSLTHLTQLILSINYIYFFVTNFEKV